MKKTKENLREKYYGKGIYCGFDNDVEVNKGLEPKICCLCRKEVIYEKLEQNNQDVVMDNKKIEGLEKRIAILEKCNPLAWHDSHFIDYMYKCIVAYQKEMCKTSRPQKD